MTVLPVLLTMIAATLFLALFSVVIGFPLATLGVACFPRRFLRSQIDHPYHWLQCVSDADIDIHSRAVPEILADVRCWIEWARLRVRRTDYEAFLLSAAGLLIALCAFYGWMMPYLQSQPRPAPAAVTTTLMLCCAAGGFAFGLTFGQYLAGIAENVLILWCAEVTSPVLLPYYLARKLYPHWPAIFKSGLTPHWLAKTLADSETRFDAMRIGTLLSILCGIAGGLYFPYVVVRAIVDQRLIPQWVLLSGPLRIAVGIALVLSAGRIYFGTARVTLPFVPVVLVGLVEATVLLVVLAVVLTFCLLMLPIASIVLLMGVIIMGLIHAGVAAFCLCTGDWKYYRKLREGIASSLPEQPERT